MVAQFRFVFRIDWRRGPKQLRKALDEMRQKVLEEIGDEVRANVPHPSIAGRVTVSAAQVVIDHPATLIFEFGAKPHFPPLEPIRAWAVSVGKDPDSAYPIARAISRRGFEPQPFIEPAIEKGLETAGDWIRRIWEGGR